MMGLIKKLFRAKHVDTFPDVLKKKFERITPAPPEPPKKPKVTYQVRGFSREFIDGVRWIQWIEYLQTTIHFRMGKNGVERYYKDTGKEANQRWWKKVTIRCNGWCGRDFPFDDEADPRPIRCPYCNSVYGFYTPQEEWIRNGCRAKEDK